MGKIVATYLVKVTVREPDGQPEGESLEAPTNVAIEDVVRIALEEEFSPVAVNATSERTDI